MSTSEDANGAFQGLLKQLCQAYSHLLRRQRTASSAFVNWQDQTRRRHEFVWLGEAFDQEVLIRNGAAIRIAGDSPIFDSIQKMQATGELNPYEREILYGYPYVVGRLDGRPVRAPVLSIPVKITADGSGYVVSSDDEVVRFNTLPFRAQTDTAARELALERIIEDTPEFPLGPNGAKKFAETLARELPEVEFEASLDGALGKPPSRPSSGDFLRLVDQAAVFVAPKTSYFLTSDLNSIAEIQEHSIEDSALGTLLTGARDVPVSDIDQDTEDAKSIYYPFQSNRAQRRVAILLDDPKTRVVRVEGPPGTGKSQTIANLACHLAATGRSVLITSQKDKALSVVDQKLRELGLPQLPMTLLQHDSHSKSDLRNRLDGIEKTRPTSEIEQENDFRKTQFATGKESYADLQERYSQALSAETDYIASEGAVNLAKGLRRLAASAKFRLKRSRLARQVRQATDELAEEGTEARKQLLKMALGVLRISLEHSTAAAKRNERQQLREFSALLRRNERSYRNFSVFDRLKSQPDRASMLLKMLPVWIMTPDDAARLFPCEAGLFDVVIIDEASQVDLPSITPIIYRAKQVVVSGDPKQMRARRFAFTQQLIALEAWQRYRMDDHDPEDWLQPTKQSLLDLAFVRADEEVLLDEHFRSLPPIIEFSNQRWYDGRLRIMTDEARKRFGDPDQPIIELHYVENGEVAESSQENLSEAEALIEKLKEMLKNPSYSEATFGVICLFEEQMRLVQDLVAEHIDHDYWEKNDLVVVNPDGFQGDERDVILYSLSYDGNGMPVSALSARQSNQEHVQGMLNVCFTRARDEVHIFHSTPIEDFTFAGGSPGAITDWLTHCAKAQSQPRKRAHNSRLDRSDSQFEADVAAALRERGYKITQQYPACGFFIDMVLEREGPDRLAVECDGELYHLDEHGQLKAEDLERQAILERAGWQVLRIPYRRWRERPEEQLARIDRWFGSVDQIDDEGDVDPFDPIAVTDGNDKNQTISVTPHGHAIMQALREGVHDEYEVFRQSLPALGYQKLGSRIRSELEGAGQLLQRASLIAIEDGEYFLTQLGREANVLVRGGVRRPSGYRRPRYRSRPYRSYRR